MAIEEDRRAANRYPVNLDLSFQEITSAKTSVQGSGRTVDLSSDAILFTASCPIIPGTRLEVSLQWPVTLDGRVPLKLVARGVVMGYRAPNAVVAIQNYEFRTLRVSQPVA
jgi:hypothetical protein